MEVKLNFRRHAAQNTLRRIGGIGGFTLLELLAVIIILGVLMAVVGISLAPQYSRKVDNEMEQLAQLFTFADETAKLQRKNLRWYSESKADGTQFAKYGFLYQTYNNDQNAREWRTLQHSQALSLRSFNTAVFNLQITRTNAANVPPESTPENILNSRRILYIDFSREEINAPFVLRVQFGSGANSLWRAIKSNGLGNYRVIYDNTEAAP